MRGAPDRRAVEDRLFERIVRVDLETDDPQHPPELLDFLGALAERCERALGRRAMAPART